MQNGQTATDGLYQGPTALSLDVLNTVRRIKLLGFNAVRMPYSIKDLLNATARDFHWSSCANIRQADIIRSVTNPGVRVPAGAICLRCTHSSEPSLCAAHLNQRARCVLCTIMFW